MIFISLLVLFSKLPMPAKNTKESNFELFTLIQKMLYLYLKKILPRFKRNSRLINFNLINIVAFMI